MLEESQIEVSGDVLHGRPCKYKDVRVVGYGDLPVAEWLTPSLTSVALPVRLIGELAVANVLRRIAGSTSDPSHRLIRAELIVRASSA